MEISKKEEEEKKISSSGVGDREEGALKKS